MKSSENYFLPRQQLEQLLSRLGINIVADTSSDLIAYCFSGDTRYITFDGVKTFMDTANTVQKVLAPTKDAAYGKRANGDFRAGKWVDAEIKSFGVQKLLTVTLKRNKITKVIRATPEHRWVKKNHYGTTIVQTSELKPGHSLAVLTPSSKLYQTELSPWGVPAGFVFGDGSCQDYRHGSRVTLWGDKDKALLSFFPLSQRYLTQTQNGVRGIEIRGLPSLWKQAPSLGESSSYLYGWLAGYFAADGTVSTSGQVTLESYSYSNLEFARDVATKLGLATYGIKSRVHKGYGGVENNLYSLVFSRHDLVEDFFLIAEHRRRFSNVEYSKDQLGWVVHSVKDEGIEEEVFCAVVPDVEAFALEDFIWVKNCPFHANRDSPAFNISLRGPHLWKCHNGKCAKRGNLLTLLMLKGYSKSEAKKMILHGGMEVNDLLQLVTDLMADKKGEAKDEWGGVDSERFQRQDADSGFIGQEYFKSRGISPESYELFRLGYVKKKDMVVIPIYDEYGKLCGTIGRERTTKRYEYSKGLGRQNTIWNIHNAKWYDSIILTEGALDSIYIHQAGFGNVGAILGSAISPPQLKLLRKYFNAIVCFFDNDEAGEGVRDWLIETVRDLQIFYVIYPDRMIQLENGEERRIKDPGELTEEEIRSMLKHKRSAQEWFLEKSLLESSV